MPPPKRPRFAAAAALAVVAVLALGGCGDDGDDQADPIDTTTSTGAPLKGDPAGPNTGAGGDAGGTGAAVDPGPSAP